MKSKYSLSVNKSFGLRFQIIRYNDNSYEINYISMNIATHREDIYTQVLSTILVHFLKYRKLELIENSIINNSAVSNYEEYIYNEVISKDLGDFNDCILNIIKSNGNLQIDSINTRNPRGDRNIVSMIIVSADHTDFKKNLKSLINNIDKENNNFRNNSKNN